MAALLRPSKEHRWFWTGILLLAAVVLANHFPRGYVILGGDVLQPMNLGDHFLAFHYGWFSGRVSILYGLFALLGMLGVSEAAQLSWWLALFLFGAYLSFWAFARLVAPDLASLWRLLASLFYALNFYTLYVFTATWGYMGIQILYIFLPLLTGLYLKALREERQAYLFGFVLAAGLASVSFSNPAFAFALALYFLLLTFFVFLLGLAPWERPAFRRLAWMVFGALVLNAYWILPLVPQVRGGVAELSASQDVVLSERLSKTSNAIFDTLRLLPTSEQERYYPANWPYPEARWLETPVAILAFLPIFALLVFWARGQKGPARRYTALFFALLVVFIALVARVRYPFDIVNSFLFALPGLNSLRSWEKLALFVPFLFAALLLFLGVKSEKKRLMRVAAGLFALFIFLTSLPFFAGGLQTRLSYILAGQKAKDFESAKESALIQIPEDYRAVKPLLDEDPFGSKLSVLPYSPGSSIGRIGLPGLKINGPHFAALLYAKRYVEPNDYYIPGWYFGEDMEKAEYDPVWITDLYGLIGVEYVLYEKGAKPKALERFASSLEHLVQSGELVPVSENGHFVLYRLPEDRVFPRVYGSQESLDFGLSPEGLSAKVRAFQPTARALEYEYVHPRRVRVTGSALRERTRVYLNERYDPLWRAEAVLADGTRRELERDSEAGYANAWQWDGAADAEAIEITYIPAELLKIGIGVSGASLLVVVGVAWRVFRPRRQIASPNVQ